jgi:hypothetical protein
MWARKGCAIEGLWVGEFNAKARIQVLDLSVGKTEKRHPPRQEASCTGTVPSK